MNWVWKLKFIMDWVNKLIVLNKQMDGIWLNKNQMKDGNRTGCEKKWKLVEWNEHML